MGEHSPTAIDKSADVSGTIIPVSSFKDFKSILVLSSTFMKLISALLNIIINYIYIYDATTLVFPNKKSNIIPRMANCPSNLTSLKAFTKTNPP